MEPTCNAGDIGDAGSTPGSGKSPGGEHADPLQYACLKNPADRGAWWATVHRITKSWTQLQRLSTYTCRKTKDYRSCGTRNLNEVISPLLLKTLLGLLPHFLPRPTKSPATDQTPRHTAWPSPLPASHTTSLQFLEHSPPTCATGPLHWLLPLPQMLFCRQSRPFPSPPMSVYSQAFFW